MGTIWALAESEPNARRLAAEAGLGGTDVRVVTWRELDARCPQAAGARFLLLEWPANATVAARALSALLRLSHADVWAVVESAAAGRDAVDAGVSAVLRRPLNARALRRAIAHLIAVPAPYDAVPPEHWARAGARDRVVETLLTVLRERDIETGEHVKRAAAYTEILLRACDADPGDPDWHDTMRGALLHDLGKISVPDEALREPGPLSDEQWSAMRRHALVSYRLLHGLDGLAGAADVAYAHHEHYDGRGYPRGLAGAAIPFGARLFAVADAFDAITSDRPYRAARRAAAARDEIERCSGTQFDPAIVAAFRRAYPELERRADR